LFINTNTCIVKHLNHQHQIVFTLNIAFVKLFFKRIILCYLTSFTGYFMTLPQCVLFRITRNTKRSHDSTQYKTIYLHYYIYAKLLAFVKCLWQTYNSDRYVNMINLVDKASCLPCWCKHHNHIIYIVSLSENDLSMSDV